MVRELLISSLLARYIISYLASVNPDVSVEGGRGEERRREPSRHTQYKLVFGSGLFADWPKNLLGQSASRSNHLRLERDRLSTLVL